MSPDFHFINVLEICKFCTWLTLYFCCPGLVSLSPLDIRALRLCVCVWFPKFLPSIYTLGVYWNWSSDYQVPLLQKAAILVALVWPLAWNMLKFEQGEDWMFLGHLRPLEGRGPSSRCHGLVWAGYPQQLGLPVSLQSGLSRPHLYWASSAPGLASLLLLVSSVFANTAVFALFTQSVLSSEFQAKCPLK